MRSKATTIHFNVTNDDLTQTAKQTNVHENDVNGPTHIEMVFRLPVFVLPLYWARHQLSYDDMTGVTSYLPATMFWMAAMLRGINASASCIKPSFANAHSVLVSSKAIAIKKLIKASNFVFSNSNKLDTAYISIDHVPPLPKHGIAEKDLVALKKCIYPHITIDSPANVECLYPMFSCLWLPLSVEDDGVLLKRVVDYDSYKASGRSTTAPFSRVCQIIYQSKTMCLVEEACLVCAV